MTERMFTMHAESLLSKWGFGDGDALSDWWWDQFETDPPFNDHDVLFTLVESHLVPKMQAAGWKVDLVKIATIHNPVRAGRLNNVEVDWYAGDGGPISIEASVTAEQILHAAEEVGT